MAQRVAHKASDPNDSGPVASPKPGVARPCSCLPHNPEAPQPCPHRHALRECVIYDALNRSRNRLKAIGATRMRTMEENELLARLERALNFME